MARPTQTTTTSTTRPPIVDEEAGGLLARPLLAEADAAADAAAAATTTPPPPPQRQRPFRLSLQKPPDWAARGLRVALALCIFLNLRPDHLLPASLLKDWESEVAQALVWGAATTVVVAASPLIGKVAQVSFERTLGTVCGGVLGVLAHDLILTVLLKPYAKGSPERARAEAEALAVFAAAIALLAAFLSAKLNLDQSMRLLVMNFLLVVRNVHEELGSFGTAIIRTSGILAGVYLYSLLAVVVLPKSASVSALRNTKAALEALASLNAAAWASLPSTDADVVEPAGAAAAAGSFSATTTAPPAAAGPPPPPQPPPPPPQRPGGAKLWRDSQRELAAGLAKTYSCIAKVEECAVLAQRERYVWHFWGHFVFVPKILPWGALTRLVLRLRLRRTRGRDNNAAATAGRRQRQEEGGDGGDGENGDSTTNNNNKAEGDGHDQDEGEEEEEEEARKRRRRARRRRLPFVGWRLPQRELDDLLQSASRAARLVWALHLSFQDGFDAETLALLRRAFAAGASGGGGGGAGDRRQGSSGGGGGGERAAAEEDDDPDLLRRMQRSLGAALATLARAFPSERTLDVGPLQAFSRAVEAGLDLDAQERERRRAQRRELEALLLRRASERERRRAERAARFEASAEGQWAAGLAGLSTAPVTPRVEGEEGEGGTTAEEANGVSISSNNGALLAAALAARLAARERRAAASAASGGVFGASYATTPLALGLQHEVAVGSPPRQQQQFASSALRRARSATLGKAPPPTSSAAAAAAAAPAADAPDADPAADASLPPAPLLEFPTHAAEVRWASLLFVADELADELETLYLAAGAVMETLPSARV